MFIFSDNKTFITFNNEKSNKIPHLFTVFNSRRIKCSKPTFTKFPNTPQCQEPLLPSGLMGLVVIFEEIMIKIN